MAVGTRPVAANTAEPTTDNGAGPMRRMAPHGYRPMHRPMKDEET